MEIREQIEKIALSICELYPDVDRETYLKYVSEMKVAENDDITDKRPVAYYQPTNTLMLNVEEIKKGVYDLEYYVTVALLMMLHIPEAELEGLRYGYYSGVASNLVGNFVKETDLEVEAGIDIYEPLRECVVNLSNKIGAEATMRLCSVHSVELFYEMYIGIGLGDPHEFLNQINYLFKRAGSIAEPEAVSLVKDTDNVVPEIGNPQKVL